MTKPFQGIYVAIPTPYANKTLDESALRRHVGWLVDQGVHGIVPCGTTGESIALSTEEKGRVIQLCVQMCHKRALVIPGVGMPTTDQTIEAAKQAEALGADGLLVITPYFVKASQDGLIHHYQMLHKETKLPLILYNNPSRTGVEISLETVCQLSTLPRVVGLKDASLDLTRPLALRQALGNDFILLSGEDGTLTAFLAQGGDGIISVSAGIAPHLTVGLFEAWKKGDLKTCFAFRDALFSLNQVLFSTTSPGPVKMAAHLLGFGSPETRLPLSLVTPAQQKAIAKVLENLKIEAPSGEAIKQYV